MSIQHLYGRCYAPTCDICGEELPPSDTWDEAAQDMKDAGWKARRLTANGKMYAVIVRRTKKNAMLRFEVIY